MSKSESPSPQSDLNSGLLRGSVSLCLAILFIGIGISEIFVFIEPVQLSFVILIVTGSLFVGIGSTETTRSVLRMLRGKANDINEARRTVETATLGVKASVLAGILGALIGTINMLKKGLSDPNAFAMGAAMALLTVFYGVLLALLFELGRARAIRVQLFLETEQSTTGAFKQKSDAPTIPGNTFGWIILLTAGALLSLLSIGTIILLASQ